MWVLKKNPSQFCFFKQCHHWELGAKEAGVGNADGERSDQINSLKI